FRSMWIAARVTIFSLLLGYPLAYYLSFGAGARKDFLYQLVIIPLWVSYLVRAYAWKTILGSGGVLNTLLQYVHLTNHPLNFLLYSPFAVVLTLTHIYTPFTFLPIFASLEHIPRNLIEASHDLHISQTYSPHPDCFHSRSCSLPAALFLPICSSPFHPRCSGGCHIRLRAQLGKLPRPVAARRTERNYVLQSEDQSS